MESGDDPFKAFDRMVRAHIVRALYRTNTFLITHDTTPKTQVLTSLVMGGSRLRAIQQWCKILFYRLALIDRDPMEGDVESERSFAFTGLTVAVAGGVLVLIFLLCAVWFIISSAIGWRLASARLVLI